MKMNNKTLIIIVAAILLFPTMVVGSATSGDTGGGITIDNVSYSSGTVSFSGTSHNADEFRCFITYPDGTKSGYGFGEVIDNSFNGVMKLNLSAGEYRFTAFTSSNDSASRDFIVFETVNSFVSILSVSYDGERGVLTFSGESSERILTFFVTYPDGLNSRYGYTTVTNGRFDGTMKIDLPEGNCTFTVFHNTTVKDTFAFVSSTGTPAVILDKHSISITAESDVTLHASAYYTGSEIITWSSSNSLIVSVDSNGKLMPKAYGTATITATSGNYSDRCEVSVGYAPLTLSKTSIELVTDSSETLSVTMPQGHASSNVVWRTSSNLITVNGNGNIATISSGSETGTATVTVIVGYLYSADCFVSIVPKQASISAYTFHLKMLYKSDAEVADVGSSGLTVDDLLKGITLHADGYDAGSALESALNSEGIPCSFWDGNHGGQEFKHWVNHIMGLGDEKLSDGNWKYWIQTKGGSYNQWSLGYYTDGGTFEITYGITTETGQILYPDDPTNPEQPHTHTWDDGVITKQPTCTEPGVKTYTCSCGETRTEIIPAGHNWSDWYIVKQATEDEEGLKERTCSISGEKETQPIPKIVIDINDDGTQTRTHVEVDGTVVSTTTGAKDGSTKVEKMKEDTDKDGNKVTMSSTEIIDKDGNSKTSSTHIVKDADGKEIYSKNEELTKKNHLDNDGNHVTTTSSTSVENKNGKRIETESESITIVATDGNKKTEIVIVETTTNADGSIESKTVRENIKESPKGDSESTKVTVKEDSDSRLNTIEIKIKDKDGKTSIEKKVEIESKDGNVKSIVKIPNGADKADIITTVKTDSNDGNNAVTKEQIEQAIVIQGKVFDEIKDDVKDHSKVIQIVSSTPDASLTVPKDAIKAASDANSSLRIVSEKGSIAASDTVLSNISIEKEITISISEAKDEHINDAQRENIPDGAVVVDVKIMAGDKDLGKSLGGLITISIRYTPADGKIGVAYHIDDDGNKVRMGGIYDPIKGEVVFDSTHSSLYMVVDEDPSKSGLSNAAIFVGIAVAVVAAIAVAIMLYMRKR